MLVCSKLLPTTVAHGTTPMPCGISLIRRRFAQPTMATASAKPLAASGLQAAQGAVVGAFVGDAAGAVLEFAPRPSLDKARFCAPPSATACHPCCGRAAADLCLASPLRAVSEPAAAVQKVMVPQVRHALTLPGGGMWDVGPGQVTDDSEMAMCLMQGLAQGQPPLLPLDAIAARYAAWYHSDPFDIGGFVPYLGRRLIP